MENKTSQHKFGLKRWLTFSLGLTLFFVLGIGATNETFIGKFFTYSLGYLFGIFYPFVLAFLMVLALKIAFTGKIFTFKNHALLWIGILLLFLSLLGLGSYFIYEAENVKLLDFTEAYADRMKAFASDIFHVDNFGALSALGGGYLGLLFCSLLGSIWGPIGNAAFFSILLVVSLFFIVFRAVAYEIDLIKERREKKTRFNSPYQGKDKQHLERSITSEEGENEETSWIPPEAFEEEKNDVEPDPATPLEGIRTDSFEQGGFHPASNAPMKSTQGGFQFSTPMYNRPMPICEEPEKEAGEIEEEEIVEEDRPERIYEEPEEIVEQEPIPEERPAYRDPYDPIYSEERANPLPKPPVVEVKRNNTFSLPPEMIPHEEVPEASEEEEQEIIVRKYFEDKRRREREKLEAQKAEKEAKRQELYQFVSDKPIYYNYPLPTDELLEDMNDSKKMEENNEVAMERAGVLNQVFKDYGIKALAKTWTIGASVTRFDIEMEPGEKSDKLTGIISELQKAFKGDKSVRVETVVEGKSTSGIEVGNAVPMTVPFKEAFRAVEQNTTDNLLVPIGKDISGDIVTYPLNKMPHCLVAGTTGSGKSVLIHSIIMTLIMRNYPSQMKLLLIDPKQVEFAKYKGESHLFCPVISKPKEAITALEKLCVEMDRRFEIYSRFGCENYAKYNQKRVGHERTMEELPAIVCVIDEFADLMQTAGDEAAGHVQRIAQKARAAAIFLIIATQRPSKDSVPMIIKGNIPTRIGLSVASITDSLVILDEKGAETLLGRGDLLFKRQEKKSMTRCQSPFVSDNDIDRVLDYMREYAGNPNYNPDFLELGKEESEQIDSSVDILYENIKDFVITTGLTNKQVITKNFGITPAKADQYLMKLVMEKIIEHGMGGEYVLTPRIDE